jgi:dTDP-L-rhamnose 4-epimerase
MTRVLITGGAGFIGSHLADLLLAHGHEVRVLDSLVPQVHGDDRVRPPYLDRQVELLHGDVRNPVLVRRALDRVDAVVHLAAAVGVGQSMYQIADYVGINDLGTAVLLEALIAHPVERLVVASSMSVYGEGLYRSADGQLHQDVVRTGRAADGAWDPQDAQGRPPVPGPTPEWKGPGDRKDRV